MARSEQIDEEFVAGTGFKIASKADAKDNRDIFLEYKGAREARYKDQVENDNFYHNKHYDESEENEIIAKGQAPVPINVMYSIIKQMISLITSENPTWMVDPVGNTDKQLAYLMRSLLDHTWYTSKGSRQLTQITKDMCIVGHGISTITPETIYGGMYAKFSHIPYHQVYIFPDTREFDYSDAENIEISRVISHKRAAELLHVSLKEMEEIAKSDEADNVTSDDARDPRIRYMNPAKKDRNVRVIQRLTMEKMNVFTIKPLGSANITRRVYFSVPEYIKKLASKQIVSVTEKEQYVLVKYLSVGEYCLRYCMPISRYNVIPFIDEFNGNPYPMGEVDFLYGLQRSLNKFVMLALLNATLANSLRMLAPKGTINKDDYQNNYAVPGSLTEYEWTEGQPQPKEMNPTALPSEFYATPKLLIHIMEYMTGIFGVVQGNPEGAPRTASGLMSLQNYGGQKVKLLGRNVGESLSLAGDVAIEMYQNYAPYNQTVTYFKENEREPVTLDYNKLVGKGESVAVENDISIGTFKTRVHLAQNYGSERNAKATLLANLAAQTGSPALLGPILKLADIPEADEIASSIDVMTQQKQTIEQLQQNMKRMEEVNKQLQNEIIQKSQEVSLVNWDAELEKLLAKVKADLGAGVKVELAGIRATVQEELANLRGQLQQSQQTGGDNG